jgi:hypothetical protein
VTLLPAGQVLVAGGYGSGGASTSAEVYSPTLHTWKNVDPLATRREYHTATVLPSGKVLVAGGFYNDGTQHYLTSVEVYDPALERWSTVTSMNAPRMSHTATLLPTGKVLVAGGYSPSGPIASAEVYDPALDTWTTVAPLATARQLHMAALLASGEVLVTGGDGTTGALRSAELYDPALATWTSVAPMATARDFGSATLLPSGKVLVAGGNNSADGILASAEVYDPALGTWTSVASLATARRAHAAALLPSGTVLVLAGVDTGYLTSAEVYDPGARVGAWWRPTIDAPATLVGPGGALALTGTGFRGSCETSGGGSAGAATDAPSVLLLGLSSGVVRRLAPSAFTDTDLTVTIPAAQGYEQGWLRVVVAGIASAPVLVTIQPGADGRPAGLGGTCSAGAECLSGNCVNGVCCDAAACADCQGCDQEHHVGTCAPLPLGTDDTEPADACTGENTCDGAGGCHLKNGGACGSDGGLCASGLCTDGVCCNAACGATCASCDVVGHVGECVAVPAGQTDDGCTAQGEACDGAGACKKALGIACSGGAQCASSNCVDGVCCDTLCDATCRSCAVPGALGTCSSTPQLGIDPPGCLGANACDGSGTCKYANGQVSGDGALCASGLVADGVCCESDCQGVCRSCDQSGYAGQCRFYSQGADPETECGGEPGCAGSCNGLGACAFPGNNITCSAQSCSDATLTLPDRCDGAGHCADAGTEPCTGGYVCDAAGDACRSSCAVQGECQTGFFCDPGTGTCKATSIAGTACGQGYECQSGFCADGVCCLTACDGACDVCNATPGTCTVLAAGAAGSPSCSPFLCGGAATCPTACTLDGECAAGAYCEGLKCVAKKPDGESCVAGRECQSTICADGVCCDGECTGKCRSCTQAGHLGECRFFAQGEDPDAECTGTVTDCNGSCDGAGACTYPGGTRQCAAQTCSGATLAPADVCDGAGHCLDSGTQTCSGGYVCNGAGTACLGSCAAEADCQTGFFCDPGTTTCKAKSTAGTACGQGYECQSGFCADGVCCGTACDGACDVCNATPGTCTVLAAGAAGSPSCSPFRCGGAATCPTSCTLDGECAAGFYCLGGACAAKKEAGDACGGGNQCQTGFCADGVCCDGECTGKCRSCAQAGHLGQCRFFAQGEDPDGECGSGTTCGGTCDGAGACSYPGASRQCAPQTCTGATLSPADLCDGAGGCLDSGTETCGGGFVCNGAGTACLGACATGTDCQTGYYCDPGTATCKALSANGDPCARDDQCQSGACVEGECCESASCGGFACAAGTCLTSCASDSHCAPGWACDVLSGACQAPAGAACAADGECQSQSCAGGFCCAVACPHGDATCGGSCDETGACTFPHDGRACTCPGGAASACQGGRCACTGADAGAGADAAAGADAGTGGGGGGCAAADPASGSAGLLLLAALLLAVRRRNP